MGVTKGVEVRHGVVSLAKIGPDQLERHALVAACILAAIYATTSLALPFGWDHGIMASVGNSYVHGGLPYVDSWDMKGPLAYLPYALTQVLFGPTMWGIRAFDIAISAIGAYAFFKGVAALTDRRIGAWAAFALYFWIASEGWFFTATPEPWTGWLCVLAIAPLLARTAAPGHSRMAMAGFLIGCAGLIKPLYLAVGIAPLLAIVLAPGLTRSRRAALALSLAAAAAAPIVLACAYYAWRGSLAEAIDVHLRYAASSYAAINTGDSAIQGFAEFFARPAVALAAPFVALGAWELRDRPHVLWPCLGWLAALMFAVAAQRKYYVYHWMPAYAPLILLAAVGVHGLVRDRGSGRPVMILATAAALTFAAEICAVPLHDAAKCIYYLAFKHQRDLYYSSFNFMVNGADVYGVANELSAERYLAGHTTPHDGVFIWGNDATIRYLADRPNPTRFTFEMPLSMPGTFRAGYRVEALQGLRKRPPAYFIVGTNWWRMDTKGQALAKFPEMANFLRQNYKLDKSFGLIDLYRRKSPGLVS